MLPSSLIPGNSAGLIGETSCSNFGHPANPEIHSSFAPASTSPQSISSQIPPATVMKPAGGGPGSVRGRAADDAAAWVKAREACTSRVVPGGQCFRVRDPADYSQTLI